MDVIKKIMLVAGLLTSVSSILFFTVGILQLASEFTSLIFLTGLIAGLFLFVCSVILCFTSIDEDEQPMNRKLIIILTGIDVFFSPIFLIYFARDAYRSLSPELFEGLTMLVIMLGFGLILYGLHLVNLQQITPKITVSKQKRMKIMGTGLFVFLVSFGILAWLNNINIVTQTMMFVILLCMTVGIIGIAYYFSLDR
jgi:hypothetical protein